MGWAGRALMGMMVIAVAQAQEADLSLTDGAADRFAGLALTCVRQGYSTLKTEP